MPQISMQGGQYVTSVSVEHEELIRKRAYFLWQGAGCPEGRAEEFWMRAVELEAAARHSREEEQVTAEERTRLGEDGTRRLGKTAAKRRTAPPSKGSATVPIAANLPAQSSPSRKRGEAGELPTKNGKAGKGKPEAASHGSRRKGSAEGASPI